MTKKTFLLMGLFVLAMSAFWMALDTYLILDSITFDGFDARGVVLRTLGIPILFGVILWKRLRFTNRSKPLAASFLVMFFALCFLGLVSSPTFLSFLDDLNPVGALYQEIAAWADSGKEVTFYLSLQAKLKMSAFNGFSTITVNWPLFLALALGAFDPRLPGKNKPKTRETLNLPGNSDLTVSALKRIVSSLGLRRFTLSRSA